jgi:hypothetical protein
LAEAGHDVAAELVRDDLAMLLGMPLHGGKQLVDRGCGAFASGHEVVGLPGMKKTGQHTAEDGVPSIAAAARS